MFVLGVAQGGVADCATGTLYFDVAVVPRTRRTCLLIWYSMEPMWNVAQTETVFEGEGSHDQTQVVGFLFRGEQRIVGIGEAACAARPGAPDVYDERGQG
jgi:hypothetical protein